MSQWGTGCYQAHLNTLAQYRQLKKMRQYHTRIHRFVYIDMYSLVPVLSPNLTAQPENMP